MKFQRMVLAAVVAIGALCVVGVAQARGDVSWSIGIGSSGGQGAVGYGQQYYVQPAPVYVQPQSVYYEPAPTYYQPAPVYVQPRPVYVQPRPVYYQPEPVYVQPQVVYQGWRHGNRDHRRSWGDDDGGRGGRHGWNR